LCDETSRRRLVSSHNFPVPLRDEEGCFRVADDNYVDAD